MTFADHSRIRSHGFPPAPTANWKGVLPVQGLFSRSSSFQPFPGWLWCPYWAFPHRYMITSQKIPEILLSLNTTQNILTKPFAILLHTSFPVWYLFEERPSLIWGAWFYIIKSDIKMTIWVRRRKRYTMWWKLFLMSLFSWHQAHRGENIWMILLI